MPLAGLWRQLAGLYGISSIQLETKTFRGQDTRIARLSVFLFVIFSPLSVKMEAVITFEACANSITPPSHAFLRELGKGSPAGPSPPGANGSKLKKLEVRASLAGEVANTGVRHR